MLNAMFETAQKSQDLLKESNELQRKVTSSLNYLLRGNRYDLSEIDWHGKICLADLDHRTYKIVHEWTEFSPVVLTQLCVKAKEQGIRCFPVDTRGRCVVANMYDGVIFVEDNGIQHLKDMTILSPIMSYRDAVEWLKEREE